MNVRTSASDVGATPVLAVEGVVDLSSVATLHSDLAAFVRNHAGSAVVVDLDGVRGLDDTGLGVLLGAAGTARDLGGDLTIVCTSESVRARIARTRLDRAIAVRAAIADSPPTEPIHHLALPGDWADALPTGEYRMSTRGRSLDDVGYIHCSTGDQVVATANRFYGDLDQLVVLTIDPDLVDAPIVSEPPVPGAPERFPHIYGPLPIAAVVVARAWTRAGGGPWSLDH